MQHRTAVPSAGGNPAKVLVDVEDINADLASTIERFYSGSPAIDLGSANTAMS